LSFYLRETYRICNFLANCCDYARKQYKAPISFSPEVYETLFVCMFVHNRRSKCPPYLHGQMPGDAFFQLMLCRKSDRRPALLNCKALSLLRTVNKQKVKCWYFA